MENKKNGITKSCANKTNIDAWCNTQCPVLSIIIIKQLILTAEEYHNYNKRADTDLEMMNL